MDTRSFAILLIACAIGACAGKQKVTDVEQILSAAGFEARPAVTQEQQAHLETLEQHEIVMRTRNDQTYFFYADATKCQCLFVGDQDDYQRFQKLALQAKIAKDYREAAVAQQQAWMNWGIWGPWW